MPIDISQAHLPSLLERVCKGEEFIWPTRAGPAPAWYPWRGLKSAGWGPLGRVDPAFFEPLPMEELEAWG